MALFVIIVVVAVVIIIIIHNNNSNDNDNNDSDDDYNDDDNKMDSPIIAWSKIASTPLVTGGEILNERNIGTSRGRKYKYR
jgi:hypothetical protein